MQYISSAARGDNEARKREAVCVWWRMMNVSEYSQWLFGDGVEYLNISRY